MARIRRHSKGLIQLMMVAVIATAAAVAGYAASSSSKVPTLSPLAYAQVGQVRTRLCLSNSDLASMGCNRQMAAGVYAALRTWQQQNEKALVADRLVMIQAKRNLRRTMRQIHMGPRNPNLINQVPTLKASVTAAVQQRETLIDSFAARVSPLLGSDQAQRWQTLRKNRGVPSRYKAAPYLQASQVRQLATRIHRGTAANRSSLSSVNAAPVLNGVQQSAIQAAAQRTQMNMSAVVQAEQAQLPAPIQPQPMMLVGEAGESTGPGTGLPGGQLPGGQLPGAQLPGAGR